MQKASTIISIIAARRRGLSYRDIQRQCRVGSGTARLIIARAAQLAVTEAQLQAMEPGAVAELFYPAASLSRRSLPQPAAA